MEYLQQHRGKERVILVSVSVQMLDDLDAEEFRLLAGDTANHIRCAVRKIMGD